MMDDDGLGTIGGMLGKGNQSTRRTPTLAPTHDLTRARIQAAAVGKRRLTA
jgi:hypothetical protein